MPLLHVDTDELAALRAEFAQISAEFAATRGLVHRAGEDAAVAVGEGPTAAALSALLHRWSGDTAHLSHHLGALAESLETASVDYSDAENAAMRT